MRETGVAIIQFAFLISILSWSPACGPQESGHSPIDQVLERAVQQGDVVGVVGLAASSSEILYQGAFGHQTADGTPMNLNSVFRIASMTKPVTSVAAMQLVEEGAIRLETRVSDLIAGFSPQILIAIDPDEQTLKTRPPETPVTVHHLLTHTAGFGYEFFNPLLFEAVRTGLVPGVSSGGDRFLAAPLVFEPGQRWHYGISTDWLGRVVEGVRKAPLDEVFHRHIFEPLGMTDSSFVLPARLQSRLVDVFARQEDGTLVVIPGLPTGDGEFFSGGAGLLSTGPDYLRFLRALLRGGELDEKRILSRDTVLAMGSNQIGELEVETTAGLIPEMSRDFEFFPGSDNRFGLGFFLNGQARPEGRSANSPSWAGIYNTYFWIDPARNLCAVLMTQSLPFFDERVIRLLQMFEQEVYRSAIE